MNRSTKNLLNKLQSDVRKLKRGMKMRQEYEQITNLHIENSSLKNRVEDLEKQLQESKENFRRLERLYTFGTPTDGLEVGSPEDYGDNKKAEKYIYESPDNGRTIYRREFGKEERVLMEGFISGHMRWEEVPRIPENENPNQLNLFND